jgi:hypothetical protein
MTTQAALTRPGKRSERRSGHWGTTWLPDWCSGPCRGLGLRLYCLTTSTRVVDVLAAWLASPL